MPSGPSVAVIVVDYDGGDMTMRCLEHLVAAGGARIVLVDNGSKAPLTDARLAARFGDGAAVEVVRAGRNLGFAGGVNLGLRHLRVARPGTTAATDAPGYVALVNNDAFVEPGWLAPLVDALDADPGVGAASAKLVFEPRFTETHVDIALTPQPRGPARGGPVDAPDGSVYGDGFVAVRPGEWWATRSPATLFVPVGAGGVSVVQNAGNELTPDLWVRDRGAREPDDGRHDTADDIWGWCGGAVLLRAGYLADVGWFDERFFLYWEDVDLSWRGARRGWRYRYVPTSVVRHRHGASMGDRSPRFEYLNQRNRLVVLARHAGRRAAATAWARHVAEIAWFAWRDVVVAVVRGHRPETRRVTVRARAMAGAVGLLLRPSSPGPGR